MRHGRSAREASASGRKPGILARLGIRGKLNLLLLPPLIAVVLVSVPFAMMEANNAGAANQSATIARRAQQLGGLMLQLQRERLLTATYVATPTAAPDPMIAQQKAVDAAVEDVRRSLAADAPDELAAALVRIGSLNELRQNALRRGVALDSVARTYHAVIGAVIDALRLVPQTTSDAEGTRELTALEALLRANEENSLRAMALIVTAVDAGAGQSILDDATQQAPIFVDRFVQQADDEEDNEQAALVVNVEQSDLGRRIDDLAAQVHNPRGTDANLQYISDVFTAADSQSGQRKLVQERVIGEITDAASGRASTATQLAWLVGVGAAALFLVVAFLAIAVSRSIAEPLRRLTRAATSVAELADTELVRVTDTEAHEEQVPRLATIDVISSDELGSLAAAFNRVQSTAAELVERQALTRRNVSLMFANVAKRTQNLVGRQLALIDEVERNEQDTRLLSSLYRLDHLSTRLRRNADNLLVVSGLHDEGRIGGPIELATALRSALAEIEDYQRVRLGVVGDIQLSSALGSDLVLLFAELFENATSFSPPSTMVEVDTMFLAGGGCLVSVVDHGIGMTAEKLAEENRRLVERERLELAPTSVLGLFVVGRLARRHGLDVELLATPGTGGMTARVTIPPTLFTHKKALPGGVEPDVTAEPEDTQYVSPVPVQPTAAAPHPGLAPLEALPALAVAGMENPGQANGFRWFREVEPEWPDAEPVEAIEPVTAMAVASDGGDTRGGLRRRVRGAQLPAPGTAEPAALPDTSAPRHDPAAAKVALDGFQTAFAKASELGAAHSAPAVPAPAPEPPARPQQPELPPIVAAPQSRNGMVRRVPGAQLAPGLRKQPATKPLARALGNRPQRDPAAERAAFDAFADGLAKAGVTTADTVSEEAVAGRVMERGEESRK